MPLRSGLSQWPSYLVVTCHFSLQPWLAFWAYLLSLNLEGLFRTSVQVSAQALVRLSIQRSSSEQIPVLVRIRPRGHLVASTLLRTSCGSGRRTQAHQFCFSFPVRLCLARLIRGNPRFPQAIAFFQGPTYAYLLLCGSTLRH